MARTCQVLRWVSAASLIILLLLFAWNCIDIYVDATVDQSQVMYQADDVHKRLQALGLPCVVLLGIVAINGVVTAVLQPGAVSRKAARKTGSCKPPKQAHHRKTQAIVLIMAVVLILLGIMNGGLYDVLVKAINICTECIGLG